MKDLYGEATFFLNSHNVHTYFVRGQNTVMSHSTHAIFLFRLSNYQRIVFIRNELVCWHKLLYGLVNNHVNHHRFLIIHLMLEKILARQQKKNSEQFFSARTLILKETVLVFLNNEWN